MATEVQQPLYAQRLAETLSLLQHPVLTVKWVCQWCHCLSCRWNHDLCGIMLSYTNLHVQSSEVVSYTDFLKARTAHLAQCTQRLLIRRSSICDVPWPVRRQPPCGSRGVVAMALTWCCRLASTRTSPSSMWMSLLMSTSSVQTLGTLSVRLHSPLLMRPCLELT